jgi:hypothetical protein
MEDLRHMRNYLVMAVCSITLFALAMDVFLLHPRGVKAAGSVVVKIQSVTAGQPTRISGDIVGFSCNSSDCAIAIREKQ